MGNIKNKPEIRFPEFTKEWEQKPLNHYLAESKKLNTDLKYDKTEVLSVSGELGCVNQIEHLGRSYAGASVHNYGVVETGDIVYTKSPLKANPYGIIRLNKGKAGIVSTLYAVYKVKKKNATGEFLDYYFSLDANTNRYLRPLVKKGAKNDMKINNAYVLHDNIFAPSIPEQKRISAFLTKVDKRLAQLKEKKTLLEEYKKGMMQKIFSQEASFKNEKGNNFPDWGKKNLGNISELITKGTTPSSFSKGGIKYIKIECLNDSNINIAKCLFITEKIHKKDLRRSILKEGDILFAIAGATIGKSVIITNEILPANTNQALAIVRLKKDVNREYVFSLLNSFYMRRYIQNNISVGAQPNLNLEQMNSFSFFYPSQQEQTKLVSFFKQVDNKISICQTKIEQTQEYKKSLLQQMFCV